MPTNPAASLRPPADSPAGNPADALVVRRARAADAAGFALLMGQPDVYANLMQLPLPTDEMWRARIEDMAAPNRNDLQLVAERGGQLVGSAGQALMQAPPQPAHSGLASWRLMGPSGTALGPARHCFPARSTAAAPPLP